MDNWVDRIDKVIFKGLVDCRTEDVFRYETAMDLDFADLAQMQEGTDQDLQPYIDRVKKTLGEILNDSGPLRPVLAHIMSTTGKLLRPRLVISAALIFDQGHRIKIDPITDVAAAFEMVHIASLVHDDIIDGSSKRRGLPAIHKIWGIHSAILTGDYLFSKANNTALLYSELGIAALLNDAVELMCRGEVAQDLWLYDSAATEADYFYQSGRKTAALMAAGCKAGAAVSRGSLDAQELLWQFGIKLGTAFQIIDDVQDIVADEKTLGKPVLNDLERGTMTLPLIYAMNTEAAKYIVQCLNNPLAVKGQASNIRAELLSCGCIQRAMHAARSLMESAKQDLIGLPAARGRSLLWAIVSELERRTLSIGS